MHSSSPLRRLTCAALLGAVALAAAPARAASVDPLRRSQWSLDTIGASSVAESAGAGVVVAVVDTGVDLGHEDLQGRLLPGRDFVDDDVVAQDEHGHGTHVAGIIAAVAGNGRGVAGVAPATRILPVRVLDAEGAGTGADVVAGIRWAADNGAAVINLSLGDFARPLFGSLFDQSFSDAVDYAWSKGAIPVVAAGNEGGTSVFGSGYGEEMAMVVTATDRRDAKPGYATSVGAARWGLAAPGGDGTEGGGILSTYLTRVAKYGWLSGTSMAAPHVAAAAAILRGAGRSPQETVDIILATAKDIGAPGDDSVFGAGRLDLAGAVRRGAPAQVAAPSTSIPARPAPAAAARRPAPPPAVPATRAPSVTVTAEPPPPPSVAPAAGPARAPADDAVALPRVPDRASDPAPAGDQRSTDSVAVLAVALLAAVTTVLSRSSRRKNVFLRSIRERT